MTKTLGEKLKELRIEKRMLQEQVAEVIGVNNKAISAYENNTRQPPYEILVSLANLYKVSTDFLLGCDDNPGKNIDASKLNSKEYSLINELVEVIAKKGKGSR